MTNEAMMCLRTSYDALYTSTHHHHHHGSIDEKINTQQKQSRALTLSFMDITWQLVHTQTDISFASLRQRVNTVIYDDAHLPAVNATSTAVFRD